jgi:hypothetical protein
VPRRSHPGVVTDCSRDKLFHRTDCSQRCDERVILASNEAVIVVESDVSGFTSQEDSDKSGALVTLQQSLAANAEEEAPKHQNGFGKDKQKEPLSASGSLQFFPPGRSDPAEAVIGIYETQREVK